MHKKQIENNHHYNEVTRGVVRDERAEDECLQEILRQYKKDFEDGFGRAAGNRGALQVGTFPCQPC
jgi:hypothetical protein